MFTEGTFFWLVINAWVWLTLAFGNYGKSPRTTKQPLAGTWYTPVGVVAGIVGFLGLWWKPFSFAILFTPATPEDVHLDGVRVHHGCYLDQDLQDAAFGETDYGLGWPTMGILAGQFAFLRVVLYCNTFFDKWPVVRKVSVKK